LTFDSGFTGFSTLPLDGSLMAFSSDRDGGRNLDLWVQQLAGGKPLRLTDDPADEWFPSFSPDGRFIAFIIVPPSLEARLFKMYVVSPMGGEPRPIHPDFYPIMIGQGGSLVWSPDSKFLIFRGRRADDPQSMDWWVAPVEGGTPVRTHAVRNLGLTAIVHYPVGWSGFFPIFPN
jgi:Tol biopolymer transport system component